MADRKLIVQVIGDDSGLQRTLNNSTKQIQQFGRTTDKALGRRGVSTAGTFEKTLQGVRDSRKQADQLEQKLNDVGDAGQTASEKLAGVAKVGVGLFAVGRGLTGAGAALEAFNGEASNTSRALGDAGDAFASLATADPAGFFKAATASEARSRQELDKYAASLTDVNQSSKALEVANKALTLGWVAQADAIKKAVGQLKTAKAAQDALNFAGRGENVTDLGGGRRAVVRFRGASVAEDQRGGLRGPGGVAIERNSRNPIVVNTEVKLDGKTVGQSTKKANQAEARRNPRQKRGPNTSPH